jgi:hypothetical protein
LCEEIGHDVVIPINQSPKVSYSTGTTTRPGTDFDTLNVTWQIVVF